MTKEDYARASQIMKDLNYIEAISQLINSKYGFFFLQDSDIDKVNTGWLLPENKKILYEHIQMALDIIKDNMTIEFGSL